MGLTVDEGDPAAFSVLAYGSPVARYAWRRDGIPLAGETNATLELTLARLDALGLILPDFPGEVWTLSVTAFDGLATSDPATIGVFIPEPTTMGLLGFGIVALLKRRRRA